MDLDDEQLKWCCRHLGHSMQIHEANYRQCDSTIERVKIARLLSALDQGDIRSYVGKTLDEISITGISLMFEPNHYSPK